MATPREQACLDAQAAINKAIECLDRVECRGDEAIEEMQQELRIVEENVAQLAEETATPCADCAVAMRSSNCSKVRLATVPIA